MASIYVALIRAVNVSGRLIKMAELRRLAEAAGFEEVSTYIQTGNVIFKSVETDRNKLAVMLENTIEAENGYKTAVFILTPEGLEDAAKHNPFRAKNEAGEGRSHIVFLSGEPKKENADKLMALQGDDYSFTVYKNILYYFYPEKYAGHTRRNINFEKILAVQGTARTYKVIDKLIQLTK
jgi:uncharacterized protein (DUF1697 family)